MGFLRKHTMSKNLKTEDLEDSHGEYIVTVDGIREEMVDFGDEKRNCVMVKFREYEKELILNKTNTKVIVRESGKADPDAQDIVGMQLVLYAVDTQTGDGTPTRGLRVRAYRQPQAPRVPQPGGSVSAGEPASMSGEPGDRNPPPPADDDTPF